MVEHTPVHTPAPPRLTGTQRLWLRELGIDRAFLAPMLPERAVVSAPAAGPGEALAAAQRASVSNSTARVAVAPGPEARPHAAAKEAVQAPVDGGILRTAETRAAASDGSPPDRAADYAASPSETNTPAHAAALAQRAAAPLDGDVAMPMSAPAGKTAGTPLVRAAAPDSPIAQADAATLQAQVEACTACGLCESRRHAVYGAGATQAKWMVVGEAPGEQEDREGLPFVGRSGQLLDAMLRAVGMSRNDDVFIANVIKCRPPGNRNPKPEEIAACSPYLMRQIALVQPAGLLVLGRFAAQVLLGTDSAIAQLRGKVHAFKGEDGREIPVVVSYHPAYLLRSPAEKARAWQDLQLAAQHLRAPH
ncbi:uracil-DNA glycosylase [Schauerella aestuarii]|uniref:uracil-DNA glycosylase n=1 Tax=Schauerella aestuarii TaxID=2511204 RepID=UPI001F28D267|nr:uracil-DNA glycosylase [Achromobacter aestuarii]